MWEIKSANEEDDARVAMLLAEGWEPFAVTVHVFDYPEEQTAHTYIYFKRQKKEG